MIGGGLVIDYGDPVESEIRRLETVIVDHPEIARCYPSRWLALELLDDGEDLRGKLAALPGGADVLEAVDRGVARLAATLGEQARLVVPDRRYAWLNEVVLETVARPGGGAPLPSDRLDRVLTHPVWGLPIFLASMWIVFKLTVDISAAFLDWIDAVAGGPLARWMAGLVGLVGLGGTWVEGLVVDGVVAGVGGLLVFIPVLMALYLALGVLEDTGYMARAAFVMDRVMRSLGLQGKSFLPMLVGFGCSVPALYATRTLERRRDRIVTGLLVPFMSCGARLPVYVLIAAVFFPRHRGTVVFALYLFGIVVALLLGFLLNRTLFKAEPASPLIMELPPYRLPTPRSVWVYMSQRTSAFLRDAGTIILGTSLVVWLLMAIPVAGASFGKTPVQDSAFGAVASAVAPVLSPAGFGSWEATGSLMTGFVAKEVVVSSMAQTYGVAADRPAGPAPTFVEDLQEIGRGFLQAVVDTGKAVPTIVGIDLRGAAEEATSGELITAIRAGFEESSGGHGALAGFAFMVFVLLYTPCMAAVAAERHELGARWMWTSIIGQSLLAWTVAVLLFQVGRLLGAG